MENRDDIFPSPSERKEKEVQEYILYLQVEVVQHLQNDVTAYDLSSPVAMHYTAEQELETQYRNRVLPSVAEFLKNVLRKNPRDVFVSFYPAVALVYDNTVFLRVLRRKDFSCVQGKQEKFREMLSQIYLYVPDVHDYTLAISPFDTDRIFSVLREQYSSVFPHAQRAWKPTQELLYTDTNAAADRMYAVMQHELAWDKDPFDLVHTYDLQAEIGPAAQEQDIENTIDRLFSDLEAEIDKLSKEQEKKTKTRGWKK